MTKIVAINGSLSVNSCHGGILRAIKQLKPNKVQFEVLDISQFPLFNQDVQKEKFPASVKAVIQKIKAADAVIFATPENNKTISAALKNAYDWLSRGGDKSCIYGKLAGLVSTGTTGGSKSQAHMRQVGSYAKLKIMQKPELLIPRWSPGFFDEKGNLLNEESKKTLKQWTEAFVKYVEQHK